MLIGYRFEEGAVLRIHSRNAVAAVLLVAFSLVFTVGPVLLLFSRDLHGTGMDPVLAGLASALMIAMALASLWYFRLRETLVLDRPGNRGIRISHNLFGRARRVDAAFVLAGQPRLQLRRHGDSARAPVRLWLMHADGSEHQLSFETIAVRPGSGATGEWLQRIAAHLQVEAPAGIVVVPLNSPAAAPRHRPPRHASAVEDAPGTRPRAPRQDDALPAGVRVVMALIGAFLAVLALSQAWVLLHALGSGTLRVSHWRGSGSVVYHWEAEPYGFLLQLFIAVLEVLVPAALAWGGLRLAIAGRYSRQG